MASSGVEIIETAPFKGNRPTVVTGFAGPGFVGNTSVMYIARNKGFKLRAYAKSHLIPPMMLLINGQPTSPFRIYGNEDNSILLMTSEAIVTAENAWTVCDKLMEWFVRKGTGAFISIEGVLFTAVVKERGIYSYSTDKDPAQFGAQPTREGAITGMNACLLDDCLNRGISWTSLFVPTNLISSIDFGASAAVIETLNRILKLGVDVSPLKQNEEAMQKAAETQRRAEPRGYLGGLRKRR